MEFIFDPEPEAIADTETHRTISREAGLAQPQGRIARLNQDHAMAPCEDLPRHPFASQVAPAGKLRAVKYRTLPLQI
jgi:hypothetical protein